MWNRLAREGVLCLQSDWNCKLQYWHQDPYSFKIPLQLCKYLHWECSERCDTYTSHPRNIVNIVNRNAMALHFWGKLGLFHFLPFSYGNARWLLLCCHLTPFTRCNDSWTTSVLQPSSLLLFSTHHISKEIHLLFDYCFQRNKKRLCISSISFEMEVT